MIAYGIATLDNNYGLRWETSSSLGEDNNVDFTFDDVILVPQLSDLESRNAVDISSQLCARGSSSIPLAIPVVAANMDSVSSPELITVLNSVGATGVIHRYFSIEEQVAQVRRLVERNSSPICVAVGVKDIATRVPQLIQAGAEVLVIDVAHGHSTLVEKAIKEAHKFIKNSGVFIIGGNVVTAEGALFLEGAGVDAIKVGIGSGSICTTRLVTGHGRGQLSAIQEIASEVKVPIIADGGIRNSGDIVKALAFGASSVMIGSLFAGTDEAPGDVITTPEGPMKIYRGMASRDAQQDFFGNDPAAPEGITSIVPARGSVLTVIRRLAAGIRAGLSYSGARSLYALQQKVEVVRITPAVVGESLTSRVYDRNTRSDG